MNNQTPAARGFRTRGMASIKTAVRCIAATGRRLAVPVFAITACIVVLLAAQDLSHHFDYHAVIKTLRRLSPSVLVEAVLATFVSYLALVGRDAAGLRALGIKLPRSLLWIGATAGSALGNALGFGALTGGAVRLRLFGVGAIQVTRLTAVTGTTFVLGLLVLSSLGLVCSAPSIAVMLHVHPASLFAVGIVLLASVTLALAWWQSARGPHFLHRLGVAIPLREVIAQLFLVAIDVGGAGVTLYLLLPSAH